MYTVQEAPLKLSQNPLEPDSDMKVVRMLHVIRVCLFTVHFQKVVTHSLIQNPNTQQVPLSEDDCALSGGYAAAMDAAMHSNHYAAGHQQDPDETTPSDVSERPSVDDVESDTGSTGALETRSLKDHKGNTVVIVSVSTNIDQKCYGKCKRKIQPFKCCFCGLFNCMLPLCLNNEF